ncbi:MAG TPA: hypothetical protein VHF50_03835 [Solirubrobacterales bacterium]|nr:hypothetical protein [Solirubrobacterales bacterium]
MGGFKRALLGYRRGEVDTAIAERDTRIWALERDAEDAGERLRDAAGAVARAEHELTSLADMVIEREREIRSLQERLREANERHDRSIASLASTASRLEEIQVQARGQATRIRMKALREAVEVSRHSQQASEGADHAADVSAAKEPGLFEGDVKLQIGPLGDFSQLVGFEDVIAGLGASEISVERFSEGRATLSVHLDEPVELLRELEERAPLEFRVSRMGDDLVLDVEDEQGPEQRAA